MTDDETNEKEVIADLTDEVADFCDKIGKAGSKLRRLSTIIRGQVHDINSQRHPENVTTVKGEGPNEP